MKYISEYRNAGVVKKLLAEIEATVTRAWMLMEVCGGQTHSLVKNGILNMLPDKITMVHGPGCPVCVTPKSMIDQAVALALRQDVIMCSFGDMVRVPGSSKSLMQARSEGGNLRVVYSPLDAIKIARENPDKEVIFFAVGFETTAPANALAVLQAAKLNLNNFSVLVSHVLVPPAMEAILSDEFNTINGFLGAGHVCSVMGLHEYYPLAEKYKIPIVVTGFEPVDLLEGILMAVRQLEAGIATVENQYARVVRNTGNLQAQAVIQEVFKVADREWRGIGVIPQSGYKVREKYQLFDAEHKFSETKNIKVQELDAGCIAGEILRGIKKPVQCPHFGKGCTPLNPLGAPMVSSEGACAAYFHFSQAYETTS
ncbi:hydrogenase formation protein HypD [Pontibacter anaerobius]|uniref:Hydrogenase formation protein HypD n=1 Tax=Pontibacter anaerobius TaxID=2993940 RepID=A0ABT3RD13_9BACT|nr:hydrogenase formation protein HypD [Pontibacter anaerobius]MCX2739733.1 hydrogenase formation protein HypD [Pontibacter anaerobius]